MTATAAEVARIAYHDHVFEHGCHAVQCAEADRLWAIWMAALRDGRGN